MFRIRPISAQEVYDYRRNTGAGLEEARSRLQKEALIEGALNAKSLDDVKVVLLALAYRS